MWRRRPDAAYKATNQKISRVRGLERVLHRTHFSSNHRTSSFYDIWPQSAPPSAAPSKYPPCFLPAKLSAKKCPRISLLPGSHPYCPDCLATRRSGICPINKSIVRGIFPPVYYYLMSGQESAEVATSAPNGSHGIVAFKTGAGRENGGAIVQWVQVTDPWVHRRSPHRPPRGIKHPITGARKG